MNEPVNQSDELNFDAQVLQSELPVLAEHDPAVPLASSADKLHNARSILCDYEAVCEGVWTHFKGGRGEDPIVLPFPRRLLCGAQGQPRFQIDYALAEKLSNIHCTLAEIAAFLGCYHDTLERNEQICVIYKKGLDKARVSLRRLQWEAAHSGNVTMLIWLGKQYLGQRDQHGITGGDGGAITITLDRLDSKI